MPSPHCPQPIRHLLERIGLDEREIDVYLTILSLKMARAQAIAKAAGQSRSHTYLILRKLQERGLVAEIERGNIIHFVAEPPERLLSYLKNRKQELEDIEQLTAAAMPVFRMMKQTLAGAPRVTVLHGLEGIKHVYRDVLTQPFISLFNPLIDEKAFNTNVVHMLLGPHAKLQGRDLLVNNAAARRYIQAVPPHADYAIRLLPKGMTFDVDVIVFGDEVAIFTFSDEPNVVRIENKPLADAFRVWFEPLWAMSEKVASVRAERAAR